MSIESRVGERRKANEGVPTEKFAGIFKAEGFEYDSEQQLGHLFDSEDQLNEWLRGKVNGHVMTFGQDGKDKIRLGRRRVVISEEPVEVGDVYSSK